MRFSILAKILPAWQHNLSPANDAPSYLANFDRLGTDERALIDEAIGYTSRQAALQDMAFQAWLKGVVAERGAALEADRFEPKPVDEYRFARRYFNPVLTFFAFGVRIAELNNPLTEAAAFISSLKVRRIDPYSKTKDWTSGLRDFRSPLLAQHPKISVIIPTLNRYRFLADALADLEAQDYKNFEVLVVDQSEPFEADFYESFDLDMTVFRQEEKALWLARNSAIQKSEGELVLLFDDDSRVEPNWISSHIRCIDFFGADISSGVSRSAVGAPVPRTYSYYKWGDQVDTGNVMIRKKVFRDIGLFDRQFEKQRQGDGEFGLRAYLAGYANISNPDAARLHLKAAEGGLREMGSWDGWRPKNFFAPRPVPSVLYLTRKYFGDRAAVYQILQTVFPSIVPYRFKRSKAMLFAGAVIGVLLLPLILVSVGRSWRQATIKLREGAQIPRLE